ncbi:MAG TPA: GNAT family N-acetyltransferase [Casimicrobiaceae bacterium]|nr:GNAT family N-acetyltransferase [Casimicrobiaceae bacterium]
MKVENDSAHSRFLVRLPEGEGELIYKRLGPRMLELVHTEVAPALRGRGVGEALAQAAIDHARAEGLSVAATCPYVQRWFAKHPEHRDLVVTASAAR